MNKYSKLKIMEKKPHGNAKGWILYQNNEAIGYYPSAREAGEVVGKTGIYLLNLYRGMFVGKDGKPRTCTTEGYYIKPANVLSYTDK